MNEKFRQTATFSHPVSFPDIFSDVADFANPGWELGYCRDGNNFALNWLLKNLAPLDTQTIFLQGFIYLSNFSTVVHF